MEALDGYINGLISLQRLRLITSLLLDENFSEAEHMQAALDATLADGHLDRASHKVLSTLIELTACEDEPTESSRQSGHLPNWRATHDVGDALNVSAEIEYSELKPGMVLRDRFTLLEQIDNGSMGKIFKAVDRLKEESGSDRPWVAIKSITEAVAHPPNALVALQKEATNARRLSHPNIIRVFDFDRDGQHVFMIMELLEGMSLAELLNQHRFSPYPTADAKSIIEEICRGLKYAHDLGIVHADVKPGNIFVTSDKRIKLLDFGISVTVADSANDEEVYAHTPSYASCEVLEGEAPTAQDDVYSMACVAYRILSGKRPYDGETALSAEKKQLELDPVVRLAPREWAALTRAMAFRRADRSPDVSSFLREFTPKSTTPATLSSHDVDEPARAIPTFAIQRKSALVGSAIAIFVIATTFWSEPELTDFKTGVAMMDDTDSAGSGIMTPGPVGPPIELRTETTAESAEPDAERQPKKIEPAEAFAVNKSDPVEELASLAQASLDAGRLLMPATASAKYFISRIRSIDANTQYLDPLRRRFAELMMLEVMVAIAEENFEVAENLIAETESVGIGNEVTRRYEVALEKAREAAIYRENNSLSAIFASTTPTAILSAADAGQLPVAELLREPNSNLGSSPAVPAIRDASVASTGENMDTPAESSAVHQHETLPLSAFEFERHVEPKFPQRAADRRLSGWVDLRFLVNAEGKTENIEIVDSNPKGSFEKAARRAISKWRFKPMTADGVPVAKRSIVRLRFDAE